MSSRGKVGLGRNIQHNRDSTRRSNKYDLSPSLSRSMLSETRTQEMFPMQHSGQEGHVFLLAVSEVRCFTCPRLRNPTCHDAEKKSNRHYLDDKARVLLEVGLIIFHQKWSSSSTSMLRRWFPLSRILFQVQLLQGTSACAYQSEGATGKHARRHGQTHLKFISFSVRFLFQVVR